jgi:hypothetical protein
MYVMFGGGGGGGQKKLKTIKLQQKNRKLYKQKN